MVWIPKEPKYKPKPPKPNNTPTNTVTEKRGRGMIDTGKQYLSVGNDILALALINIQDIFKFTLTAKDSEIEDRYGSEECAVMVAEKYLNIARDAIWLEKRISGWSMKYSMPIKDSDERVEKIARFYDGERSEE